MGDTAVVFVRIGWMRTYEGSRTEEKPEGGEKNNHLGLGGGERDNFLPDAFGRLHGYFAIGRGNQDIELFRVNGRTESRELEAVSPVLVIFVATRPRERGAAIVGWYSSAVLYRAERRFRPDRSERVEAPADKAVLIPFERREHLIPRASPSVSGIGQSNIFYLFEPDGQKRSLPWVEAAIKYVMEYEGPNALRPLATDVADPVTAAEVEQDRQAGFASNPVIRKLVEEHATTFVRKEYEKRGFLLEDRHTKGPYDFRYKDGDTERFIEVKGSRQSAPAIILTANEVEFARRHSAQTELCVVHSIEVKGNEKPMGHGGILEVFTQWNPDSHQLAATQYKCKLDRKLVNNSQPAAGGSMRQERGPGT